MTPPETAYTHTVVFPLMYCDIREWYQFTMHILFHTGNDKNNLKHFLLDIPADISQSIKVQSPMVSLVLYPLIFLLRLTGIFK